MVKRLDIVKLGATAQERHTVVAHPVAGRVYVKQHTTGKVREVAVERCVVIGHADDYQHAGMVRGSADLVQGDAKLRENSGDADATENHNEQER